MYRIRRYSACIIRR